ncbi:MAG: hypothetical protein U0529_17495 [Thermoanaerobaculia bacterium]
MSKKPDGASPAPDTPAEGGPPESKGDGRKALLFFFGAIAFILALKFLLGY